MTNHTTGQSAYGLKPNFTNIREWRVWRRTWASVYVRLAADIRRKKHEVREAQKRLDGRSASRQKALHQTSVVARKMMTLLEEGRARMRRIRDMERQIAEQMATFPLTYDCDTVDVHYNRGSNEFPQLPMWVVKAKGRSFYVHHITSDAPWTTREKPDASTRGMLRFRRVRLSLTEGGEAVIHVHDRNPA